MRHRHWSSWQQQLNTENAHGEARPHTEQNFRGAPYLEGPTAALAYVGMLGGTAPRSACSNPSALYYAHSWLNQRLPCRLRLIMQDLMSVLQSICPGVAADCSCCHAKRTSSSKASKVRATGFLRSAAAPLVLCLGPLFRRRLPFFLPMSSSSTDRLGLLKPANILGCIESSLSQQTCSWLHVRHRGVCIAPGGLCLSQPAAADAVQRAVGAYIVAPHKQQQLVLQMVQWTADSAAAEQDFVYMLEAQASCITSPEDICVRLLEEEPESTWRHYGARQHGPHCSSG